MPVLRIRKLPRSGASSTPSLSEFPNPKHRHLFPSGPVSQRQSATVTMIGQPRTILSIGVPTRVLPVMPSTAALHIPSLASPKIASRQNRTRARILAQSGRLFLGHGFQSVCVDDIVAAAEIARSSFYRFFSNREEVLASIIRPVFESGVAMMKNVGERPPHRIMDGVFGVYLQLWKDDPDALQLATRTGGAYFRLFEDAHHAFRGSLTALVRRVEPTGMLLNASGDHTARIIARTAVPVLDVYRDDPRIETVFRQTMSGLLVTPEART